MALYFLQTTFVLLYTAFSPYTIRYSDAQGLGMQECQGVNYFISVKLEIMLRVKKTKKKWGIFIINCSAKVISFPVGLISENSENSENSKNNHK